MKRKGFTLIELLVVIVIIGILAGIVLTTTYVAKQKARVAAGKGMLSSFPAAMVMCRDGGGNIRWPQNNQPICSDQSASDDKYPDLSGSNWEYTLISPASGDSDNTYLWAKCTSLWCGPFKWPAPQMWAICSSRINGCYFDYD